MSQDLLREDQHAGKSSEHHVDAAQVQIPLWTLLYLSESKTFADKNLAETSLLAHELKALYNLSKLVGWTDSVFWRATRVFRNSIADADNSLSA
jgi:hypothetical protein